MCLMFFSYANLLICSSQKHHSYELSWHTLTNECFWSRSKNSQHVFLSGLKPLGCASSIKHCCSCSKHYLKAKTKSRFWKYKLLTRSILPFKPQQSLISKRFRVFFFFFFFFSFFAVCQYLHGQTAKNAQNPTETLATQASFNTNMYILHTSFYTVLMVLVGGICFIVKTL